MSTVVTEKFVRKPMFVDAVRVTEENFGAIADWCQGQILESDDTMTPGPAKIDPSRQHIRVRVHNPKTPRQTKAFVGDWILYTDRGYKVYTNKAFVNNFDQADNSVQELPFNEPVDNRPPREPSTHVDAEAIISGHPADDPHFTDPLE